MINHTVIPPTPTPQSPLKKEVGDYSEFGQGVITFY